MPRPTDRPSIRDVAALAGVSYQTVSRVLNEPRLVRPDTTERVQQAIARLGYRPSKAARSLATNDSMTIGVVSVHAALFGPSQMTLAIDEGARARGYATATVTVRDDSAPSLEDAREHLLGLGVDGVVVIAWSRPMLDLAGDFASAIPTSVVAEGEVDGALSRARGDHHGGAVAAVRALRSTGRRRIAHLAGPSDWLEALARAQGWREAAGPAVGPEIVGGWGAEHGYAAVDTLLAQAPDIDAIFAANDHLAAGALKRLTERGVRVPDDVALVGYDDIELAPYLSVPLASVRQPFEEVGAAAVELLFAAMDGAAPSSRTIASQFVWRASAGR